MPGIPWHPLVVHFPIVLGTLLPVAAVLALLAIRRGTSPRWSWSVVVALAALLAASAWVAVKTGERDEEAVEEVVGEEPIHTHEEAGELFLVLSAAVTGIAALGLLGGGAGKVFRAAATAGAVTLVVAAVRVGHSGGELVYRHGAATAHTDAVVEQGEREVGGR